MKKVKTIDNLLIFHIEGYNYGIWETHIKDIVRGVCKLHKLPYFPKRVAGISTVEFEKKDTSGDKDKETSSSKGRMGTFFDLGYSLGHKKLNVINGGYLFTMAAKSAKEPLEGFATSSPLEIIEVNKKEILPMPKVMQSTELLGCIPTTKGLVPVVDIKSLYKDVKEKDWTLPAFDILAEGLKGDKVTSLRVITLPHSSGEDLEYGINDSLLEKDKIKIESSCKVGFAPSYVECFALTKNGLIALLNMGSLVSGKSVDIDSGAALQIKGGGLGILVSKDGGVTKSKVNESFPLASTNIISSAIIKGKELVPIINLSELFLSGGRVKVDKRNYESKRSDFSKSFGKEESSILQFFIRGVKQSIPRSEEEDSFPLKKWRIIDGLPAIILGVVEHKGDILPLLDPAVCFGFKTKNPYDKMVLIKKDNFRAFIITEDKPVGIVVEPSQQKGLPLVMDKDYIYGCYVESESVGLVLNMEALVLDYDEEEFKGFFGVLAEEMDLEPVKEEQVVETSEAQPTEETIETGQKEENATVESSEEFSEKLKIDATVFEGLEDKLVCEIPEEDDGVRPNIKEEFLKYEKSLEDKDANPLTGSKEVKADDEADNGRAEFLDYEEDVTPKETKEAEQSKVVEQEDKTEQSEEDRNVHEFSTSSAGVDSNREEVNENEIGDENKRLLLIAAGAIVVLTILLMLFISGGKEEEITKAPNELSKIDVTAVVVEDVASSHVTEEVSDKSGKPNILIVIDPAKEEVNIIKLKSNAPKPEGAEVYVVVKGDTLWHIARRLTGNPFNYPKLAESSEIKDPDLIYPDQKIYVKVI